MTMRTAALIIAAAVASTGLADEFTFRQDGTKMVVEGNVLKKDSVGDILFEGRDTRQYVVRRADQIKLDQSGETVPYWTKPELKKHLLEEYGSRFKVMESNNYLVVFSCTPDAAKEAGRLLNRAFGGFTKYFADQGGFKFKKPPQPLIAVVFGSREEYVSLLLPIMGSAVKISAGVYIPSYNRIFMYNAFGGKTGDDIRRIADHNADVARSLSADIFGQNVSVIVHEAIHQSAFNTGFHNRNVIENPVWLVEGMAMFFEVPNLESIDGWRGGKVVNPERASRFQQVARSLPNGFLAGLVTNDEMFRSGRTALDSYAIAWTVTFYMLKQHRAKYMNYLRFVNDRPLLTPYTREERIRHFEEAFGKSVDEMEKDFRKNIGKVLKSSR